ncbi:hypothetical protein DXG01_014732 [Tephrocybe rancida]|nr:hypothetical protein DXG01_014732 [Tephrocybe rancida]
MPLTLLSAHDCAPQSTPDIQMPNVFVVPPEEDETPAWCCFDANEPVSALATSADTNFLDEALSMLQVEPASPWSYTGGSFAFQDGVVTSGKSRETRSIMDVLMNDDYIETDDEMDLDPEPEEELDTGTITGNTSTGNDSDVVEVVKVGRYVDNIQEKSHTPTPPVKPSNSLKSRASKALRSLKNVGKGSLRSKSKVQPTSYPADDIEPPPMSKTPLSRRSSAMFTQLFSPPSTIQSISPVSSFGIVQDPTLPLAKGPRYPSSLRNAPPPDAHPLSIPGSPTSSDFDYHDLRSPSPTPSAQTTSNRRRFSMMGLSRVFSFSSSSMDEAPPTMSRNSGPSSSSSSGPDTPTDESPPLPLHHFAPPPLDHGQKRASRDTHVLEQADISFEMRLDSLHFESLSFDADRF